MRGKGYEKWLTEGPYGYDFTQSSVLSECPNCKAPFDPKEDYEYTALYNSIYIHCPSCEESVSCDKEYDDAHGSEPRDELWT